jgi:hypothetical protein
MPLQHIIEDCNLDEHDIYYSSWCDKIGGKIWWYSSGGCEDIYNTITTNFQKEHKRKPILNHYARKQIDKHKLNKLKICGWWMVGECDTHLYRYYKGKRSKYLKQISNKKVRRCNDIPLKGNGFHKVYDYWYELY